MNSKGKIYIAGPMRGIPEYNFPAFHEAQQQLTQQHWQVISPADMDISVGFDPATDEATPEFLAEAMARDVDMIVNHADALALLPGWEDSVGATAELALAKWKGIPVYAFPSMVTLDELQSPCDANDLSWVRAVKERWNAAAEQHHTAPHPTGLPTDAAARKAVPIASGFLDYFPDAIAAVAACSYAGNEQHNPGKPLHWDRSKSGDEADALMRHFMQRGTVDSDGVRHATKAAWRAMALLQKEIEANVEGQAPLSGAKNRTRK